jgi:o-succinylbenzoate synthase
VQLASLPAFTLPGDLSASDRYYREEIIDRPFVLGPGSTLSVPKGPGIGVEVLETQVRRARRWTSTLRR